VIGTGPLHDTLVEQARQLGLDGRVFFRGRLSDEELSCALGQADLAIIPSLALEGFGLATVEALWHGTPALVTPSGANPEIVADLDPDLIAGGTDAAALAEAITRLLDRRGDWNAELAREYVHERYSVDSVVRQVVAIYEEALG
jgi:glycosyltransferase involved in cell wall biosynthesis